METINDVRGLEDQFTLDNNGFAYVKAPTNFTEWSFPHGDLPDVWTRPAIEEVDQNTSAKVRDISCRITQFVDMTEEAHILPKSEVQWFVENDMSMYILTDNDRLQ